MDPESRAPRFEDVYPHSEFAPLVHLVISLAQWIVGFLAKRSSRPQTGMPRRLLSGRH